MWRKFWSGPSSALLLLILAGCDQPPPVESSIAAPAILLPEMGQLSNFTLTDQNGNAFASDRMRDRIWVVDFIYTTCQAACPRMSREMTKVQEAMKDDPGVRLLSISVDPQHDTPQVLKAFGERYRADFTRWSFLTGKADLIRKLQREASVDMDPEQIEQSHNKCFILLDSEGYIRGTYKTDPPETDQLLADIAALKRNPGRPIPAGEPN